MATQDLGNLGPSQAKPLLYTWRWWYQLPHLTLWMIVLLALVVPKANRNWRAWLILIPLVLVLALWQMPVRLLSMPSSSAGFFGYFATSLAIAWTLVWLVGHWLTLGHPRARLLLTLFLMLAIGVWAHVGDYGFALDSGMLQSTISFAVCALALLMAMGLARLSCRNQYRPGRFMAWLALWMFLAPVALMLLFAVLTVVAMSGDLDPVSLVMIPVVAGVGAGFVAVSLYLFNLPFMILAFRSPFYRERLQTVFGLRPVTEEAPGVCPFGVGAPDEPDDAMVESI